MLSEVDFLLWISMLSLNLFLLCPSPTGLLATPQTHQTLGCLRAFAPPVSLLGRLLFQIYWGLISWLPSAFCLNTTYLERPSLVIQSKITLYYFFPLILLYNSVIRQRIQCKKWAKNWKARYKSKYMDGKWAHEKMLKQLMRCEGNADSKHNEILLHDYKNGW